MSSKDYLFTIYHWSDYVHLYKILKYFLYLYIVIILTLYKATPLSDIYIQQNTNIFFYLMKNNVIYLSIILINSDKISLIVKLFS